jgi:polysaccharide deacetylase family protein (PEP-CTERM system associated)
LIPGQPAGDGAERGAEPAVALSVDVEDYYQVQAFARIVSRSDWASYPSRVERNTRLLLDLFDRTQSRGTFFTLGWVARAHPALVAEIAARGHEVASHGMDHRMLSELTPDEFRAQARDSRALLEDLSGQPVIGFRAPSYSVDPRTLWAIDILEEEGYAYDSSVYPIRRRRYGYPGGPNRPVRLRGEHRALAEFPLPTLALGPARLPVLAGAYLRLLPAWLSLYALRLHLREGIPVVVNVHPWEIDPGQPTIGSSRWRTWTHYTRLAATESILRQILACAPFRSLATRLRDLGLLAEPAA